MKKRRERQEPTKWNEMTEQEKIAEGLRLPYLEPVSFREKRTEEEREFLGRMKVSATKNDSNWIGLEKPGLLVPVTVHLKNPTKSNTFKTTHHLKVPNNRIREEVFMCLGKDVKNITKMSVNGRVVEY